jgi:hypothetical protein
MSDDWDEHKFTRKENYYIKRDLENTATAFFFLGMVVGAVLTVLVVLAW